MSMNDSPIQPNTDLSVQALTERLSGEEGIPSPAPAEGSEPPAPLPLPTQPKKKKRVWLWVLLPVCILLILALTAGGLFAYWYTKPETVLKGAVSSYLGGFVHEDEWSVLERIAQANENGKVHLGVEESDLSEQDFFMNVYSNVNEEKGMIDLTYGSDSLKWYVSPDKWVLTGSMTGNEVLGVKPQGLYQQFEQSVFGSPDRSSASIVLNQYEKAALEELFDELEHNDLFAPDTDSVNYGEKYLDLMVDLLDDHSTATVSSKDGVQTNTYVFTPDGLNAYVGAIFDELKKDMEETELAELELNLSLTGESESRTLLQLINSYRREMEKAIEQMKENGQTATLTITSSTFPHALQSVEYAVSPTGSSSESGTTYTLTVESEYSSVLVSKKGEEEQMRITYLSYGGVRRLYVDGLNNLQRMDRMMELSLTYVPGQSYELRYFVISQGVEVTMDLYGEILEDTEDAYVFTLDQMSTIAIKGNQFAKAEMKYGVTVGFYPNEQVPEFPESSADLFALSIADVVRLEQNSGHTIDELEKQLKKYLDEYMEK